MIQSARWTQKTKVLIQGVTESVASHHVTRLLSCGTNIVAGVSSGQGGQALDGIPTYNLVEEAIAQVGEIEVSLIFSQPYAVLDAALEAIAAGLRLLILATEGIPPLDLARLFHKAQVTNTLILGPGSAGIVIPEKVCWGTSEPTFYRPGNIGLISRADRLADRVALHLTQAQLGQSMAVHLGKEPMLGSTFTDWLSILNADKATEVILLVEQHLRGNQEAAVESANAKIDKPIVVYIAGSYLPSQAVLGDAASAIAARLTHPIPHTSTAGQKLAACKKAKIPVAKSLSEIPDLVQKALQKS